MAKMMKIRMLALVCAVFLFVLMPCHAMAQSEVDVLESLEDGTTNPADSVPAAPDDQELTDAELRDEHMNLIPVPEEAIGKTMYPVDAEKELLPSEDWGDDMECGEGDMEIPQLFQYDYKSVVCFYDQTPKSVATSGCGATSMSMVIAYLTGNTQQSPYTLFRWAVNSDRYEGSGLAHQALCDIGAMYGVGGQWKKSNEQLIMAALRQGYPVIAHMGPGQFTNRGHYIVLRGLTEDGKIRVNDPNSLENSMEVYDFKTIDKQTRTNDPYMICYKTEE